jgi:hypothetical protein
MEQKSIILSRQQLNILFIRKTKKPRIRSDKGL